MSSAGKKRVRDLVKKDSKFYSLEDQLSQNGFDVHEFGEEEMNIEDNLKKGKGKELKIKALKKVTKPLEMNKDIVDLGKQFSSSSSSKKTTKSKLTASKEDGTSTRDVVSAVRPIGSSVKAVPSRLLSRDSEAPVTKQGALRASSASSIPMSTYRPSQLNDQGRGESSSTLMDNDDNEEDEDFETIRSSSKKLGNLLEDSEDDKDVGKEKDDEEDDDEFDEDEDGDLDGDTFAGGDIIKAQKKLDQRRARIAEEAEKELMLAHAGEQEQFSLPTEEELEEERARPPNLPTLKRRISDLVHLLQDFRSRRDPLRSRTEYVECLAHDFSDFYGYNRELVDLFLQLFSPTEALEFFEANETPRPVVIRVNTLKTKRRDLMQALMNRGVNLEPVGGWTKVGLKVFESPVPIGATPEYLAGHYMLQSAASLWPVIALDPQPGERIVDLASAPGGKTSHIAQLQGHSGVLVANDLKKQRIASLQANLTRLGVTNSVICCMDGRKLPEAVRSFDRALLDAPCTGLGVLARDPAARTQKTMEDVLKMAQLQKQLILSAIDCVDAHSKTGGVIVYSTCSVAVEENEAVVNYALRKRNVRLIPFLGEDGSDVGRPGFTAYASGNFHPDLRHTRRFYPHVHNMDGFFVAKFKKVSNDIPTTMNDNDGDERDDRVKKETSRQRDDKNKHAVVEKEEDEDIDMEEDDEQDDEEEIQQALMSSKSKKTKFNNDEIKGRIESTKNSTSLKKEHLSTKPSSSSSSLSNPTKLIAAPALSVNQLGAQIAETAASRTKNKRLPAERTTPAEIEMQRKISDLVFSKSTSTTSSAGSTSAIMSVGSGSSTLDKKSMKSLSSMRSSSALVNDDEENEIDPSSLGGVGEEEGGGAVFDFLKPGEKIHSKKRKAGKKVAAQKEAKRSSSSSSSSSSGLKKK